MEKIALPVDAPSDSLASALTSRRSYMKSNPASPVSLATLGTLLKLSVGTSGTGRVYPSGGPMYPIETYILTTHEGALTVFHYHPTDHALEKLWTLPPHMNLQKLLRQDWHKPSCLIVFTAVWSRSTPTYGEHAYPLALLEAGHMSQNVLLVAQTLGINARPLGGFKDDALTTLLDIETEREQPVHVIAFK